jgi:hypothetical protein
MQFFCRHIRETADAVALIAERHTSASKHAITPFAPFPHAVYESKTTKIGDKSKTVTEYTYRQLPLQKLVTRPSSLLNRQGG